MFEMNFLVTFLFVSMSPIISLGLEFTTKPSEGKGTKGCSSDTTKYLISAETGMLFYQDKVTNGLTNVTYDCVLGNEYDGTICLDDEKHPQHIDWLIIKNCANLTVKLDLCEQRVNSLQITDVEELTIETENLDYRRPVQVVITDVENLKILKVQSKNDYYSYDRSSANCHQKSSSLNFLEIVPSRTTSWILKNVHLEALNFGSLVHLNNNNFIEKFYDKLPCTLLSIKDSRIGDSKEIKFVVATKEIYFVNNTFERIDSESFIVHSDESFVFSGNHVKQISGPLLIKSPKIDFVGNTIDYTNNYIFKIDVVSLNVSSNRIKSFNSDIMHLIESSRPDVISLESNYFDCTCGTAIYLEKSVKSIIDQYLLDDSNNNVCVNLGNCPLRKVLGNGVSVCSNRFVCPKDIPERTTHEQDDSQITLKEILVELKNLTKAIYLLLGQYQEFKYSAHTFAENSTNTSSF